MVGLFSHQEEEKEVTSSDIALRLQESINANAEQLAFEKEIALSSFRATVSNLQTVNESLRQDVALADQMIEVCAKRKADAELAIKDNENVCAHILAIIGNAVPVEESTEENLQ